MRQHAVRVARSRNVSPERRLLGRYTVLARRSPNAMVGAGAASRPALVQCLMPCSSLFGRELCECNVYIEIGRFSLYSKIVFRFGMNI